ncbi:hypothetical protein Q6W56_003019 [Salmonella enterica]|nr:hypothetical protein [Salmonella enterica subsp. enterica serovar Oranienburg]EGX8053506.1 hypothetical protein [Salmonella enterica subsp. enterica serovar Inganda]EIX6434578.1 hypothetical protein [Salmonella enterica]EJX0634281.1 hypothetical protein [Salmonella enterica]ELC6653751.1 hypothetical protein [Salmonella enterica]
MYSILRDTSNSSMPVWFTINEAVDIINSRTKSTVKFSDLCRFALYGHITFSVYFQSPVILRRVSMIKNNTIQTIKIDTEDIVTRLCYLSSECIINNDNRMAGTEGDYIPPPHFIMDTSLRGPEYAAVQKLLARELNFPLPITGQYDVHHGVLVHDDNNTLYQVFEVSSYNQRISRQLQYLPISTASHFHEVSDKSKIKDATGYFPVYHFPEDACFVVKRDELEQFIHTFFPQSPSKTTTSRLSTPVSRLLWLACKHNDHIGPLVEHPYKLLSVFEQWAAEEGITDNLSGDTLKTALERGSPVSAGTPA